MTRLGLCAVAALALSGCGSSNDAVDADGDGEISASEAQAAAARVRPLEPGEYKMNMELVSIEDPSLSEEEIAQAKQFFGAMSGMAPARCLTEEEAAEGMTGIAEGLQQGDCDTTSLTTDQNGMQGEMICKGQDGEARITIGSPTRSYRVKRRSSTLAKRSFVAPRLTPCFQSFAVWPASSSRCAIQRMRKGWAPKPGISRM